ncbi:S46 family peptidase [Alteromonas sp. 5E99-2]|uniref:S46 family peptidase n=1 Tax=Alteromonas sp. 5E99-2 TaxID=2817683 RepID=UPI001A9814A7|nr:S46 family peptidase [Alteromonas sp. 5E99-2]MBO1255636.1 S46 family peptidase [Alteromonas sp. 5E99-2]
MIKKIVGTSLVLLAVSPSLFAKEGMFTPEQLPIISSDLQATGLKISPESLSSLTSFPMGAVVDLQGCSASFVSEQGLVVTNHHCARGSVQFNSTADNNYLENGFLAKNQQAELPAAPGTHILVTTDFSDVTAEVLNGAEGLTGKARYDVIEANQKAIIAQCEQDEGHRCRVPSFFSGLEYKLIKQLEIKDVRIAYSPADSVGKYGGDIDNWIWPRHTGDFAFYRAYVSKDGKSAEYSKDNVPFTPPHHLKVSAKPLVEGDFVMAAGYPGSTSRYTRSTSVEYVFSWLYPTYVDMVSSWIELIEKTAPKGSDARVKYEASLAGLNNFLKNTEGQLAGAKRVGLENRRLEREAALTQWLNGSSTRTSMKAAIAELDLLLEQRASVSRQQFWYQNAKRSALLSTAITLYKNAIEQEKPDAERDFGFQSRDLDRLQQQMLRLDRRFDADVDKAVWLSFINLYMSRPDSEKVDAFDNALLKIGSSSLTLGDRLDDFYVKTRLTDVDQRLALLKASKKELEDSNDPFIKMAVALYATDKQIEDELETLEGKSLELEPEYMKAIIAWQASQGKIAYPDANSTLRVTYGKILGGSPKDGLIYEPFTRVEGIVEKDTGNAPFNSPKKQLSLIADKDYGSYADPLLKTVPVNFLTDLDSTGGNSGSATLNSNAELIGLLFDGTFESVNSDWDFDPKTTRTIHVDTRYMLWVMEHVDGAVNLINEMEIVR